MSESVNHCLECDYWVEEQKVCTYEECSECECDYIHSLPEIYYKEGWGYTDEHGYFPDEWNPDYKWDRKLRDKPTEGNK